MLVDQMRFGDRQRGPLTCPALFDDARHHYMPRIADVMGMFGQQFDRMEIRCYPARAALKGLFERVIYVSSPLVCGLVEDWGLRRKLLSFLEYTETLL